MFFRPPPSMYLDCRVGGKREHFYIHDSVGFSLKGFSDSGDRIVRKQDTVKPEHWQRIWDHLNPTAVLTWVSEPDDSVRSDHAR